MRYKIEVTLPGHNVWFKPSEINGRFNDEEPTLNHAIKAERFFQRMHGFATRRSPVGAFES